MMDQLDINSIHHALGRLDAKLDAVSGKYDDIAKRIDRIEQDVKDEIDTIKEERLADAKATLRTVISYIVTFILGGGLLTVLELILRAGGVIK